MEDMRKRIYAALIHHPVIGKEGEEITSAVTNLDLHDLSRLARTYGLGLYVVTPDEMQRGMALKIIRHWTEGHGAEYNGYRKSAFDGVKVVSSMEEMVNDVTSIEGKKPLIVSTCASTMPDSVTFEVLRDALDSLDVFIILFGTGWGLSRKVIRQSDYVLEPIGGKGGYNHLSVRSAASIIVDRLLGRNILKERS